MRNCKYLVIFLKKPKIHKISVFVYKIRNILDFRSQSLYYIKVRRKRCARFSPDLLGKLVI